MSSAYATAEYKRNRLAVLEAAHYQCHYCGKDATTADHIVAVANGGGNEISNLLPCCVSCNSTKQDKTRVRLQYWNPRYK